MPLPTAPEVNAIARNAASFAAGIIALVGLGSKLPPDTVTAIFAAFGSVVNDVILLVGLVTPLITAYFARASATPAAQAQSVAETGAMVLTSSAVAAATPSPLVIDRSTVKVTPVGVPVVAPAATR